MNLIFKSVTRVVVCSSIFHSSTAALPRRKLVISQQVRFSSAAVNGKTGGGGRKPRAKAPAKIPELEREKEEKELPRPKEIVFQPEVGNWVNLIGFVDQPVQFEASSDGKFWAGTVISQRSDSDSSAFWVPIIFEGDLAKIAARYVKKDDQIHISGKLFIDSPPPNVTYAQASVQVMVQNLNFVHPTTAKVMKISSSENGEGGTKKRPPGRPKKVTATEEASDTWKHLLVNPKDWWDHRDNKANGSVKPRHPDFKRKDGSLSLWLNKAPDWVLPELEGIKFDVPVSKPREVKQRTKEESWKDLVQNPDKWWDNRSNKVKGT
ncbi:PREDICTED: protein OSB2, chloroplastic isoform X2 [Tarenaya hassleriana]|uniref:protein OSB2, chloroplastic isoform X2 n=1 Tax=Tarenaya hassleriana TaxID=28532 RepID=UPI00053C1D95|nr:PREDICTED: protein OSB2, chloroplastic isoform X2 [Tarenaya hassleriana]